ncbi:DUF421 domain-containing protein [Salibacterium salarium]|uniref:DUF421 domain-containing protein n=1 Tax=Salibacterium salarium TaxID=284579 RepID=A0A428MVJ4_9BACI|nr:DUF421 domain-containing protein [Salibacterium salarium]RSL30147.1 DUF421 domain-containing protein [Salibacterium salarium]
MNTMMELLVVAGRVITILPLLLIMAIFMGKRAIGELPIFDFLIVLTLGSVVGADIADPSIQHLHTAVAIILIAVLQRFVAILKLKNRDIGKYITFEPTIIIQNGILIRENLEKIRYSVDNVLEALREKDVFDVNEVETAIVEANGSLSVLKKPRNKTVTLEDINIVNKTSSLAFPVIIEGKIHHSVLTKLNINETWLKNQLKSKNIIDETDVFFASINRDMQLHITLKEENDVQIPPLYN